ncbi:MAG: DUF6230 family protein [Micromonosporaceae bacterium]
MGSTAHSGFQLQTNWRQSMTLLGLLMGAVAALSYGMARGAVAANYAVSGAPFKVVVGEAKLDGMVAYPDTAMDSGEKRHPVLLAGMGTVQARDVCMSMSTPTPFGTVGFRLNAGADGKSLTLRNTVADTTAVADGAGTLTNAQIGRDASEFDNGVTGPDGRPVQGPKGRSGVQVGGGSVKNLKASALTGTAGSLSFNSAKIDVGFTDVKECY